MVPPVADAGDQGLPINEEPAGPADVARASDPERPDVTTDAIRQAAALIMAAAHADSRQSVDLAMGSLVAAYVGNDVVASRMLSIRQSVRKAVREAWTDGITVPLVRSRDPYDRSLLRALPDAVPFLHSAEIADRLDRAASHIPQDAVGTHAHVRVAQGFLASVAVVVDALEGLDGLVRNHDGDRRRGMREVSDASGETTTRRVSMVRRRIRDALLKLAAGMAEAVIKDPAKATGGAGMPKTTHLLATATAVEHRRHSKEGATWREGLALAIAEDVLDGAVMPMVAPLVRSREAFVLDAAVGRMEATVAGILNLRFTVGTATVALATRIDLSGGAVSSHATVILEGAAPEETELGDLPGIVAGLREPSTIPGPRRRIGR